MWREGVIGQGFPVGELPDTRFWKQPLQFFEKALALQSVARKNDQQRLTFALREFGDEQALSPGGNASHDMALPDVGQVVGQNAGGEERQSGGSG